MSKITGIVENITYNKDKILIAGREYPIPVAEAELPDELKGKNINPLLLPNNDVLLLNNGIWLFDYNTQTITKLYDATYNSSAQIINDSVLISGMTSSSSGILRYDIKEKTITKIRSSSSYQYKFTVVANGKCLIYPNTSPLEGLLLYDDNTKSITVLSELKFSWFLNTFKDRCLCSPAGPSATSSGTFIYDSINNTFEKKYDEGTFTTRETLITKDFAILSSNNIPGILLYEYNTNTFTNLFRDTKYSALTGMLQVTDTKYLLPAGTSVYGLYMFNRSDNSIKKIFETGAWSAIYADDGRFRAICGNKCLLSNSTSSGGYSGGLIVINLDDDSVIQLNDTGMYGEMYVIRDRILVSSSSTALGLNVYNSIDDSFTNLFASGSYTKFYTLDGNNKVFFQKTNGICLYDYETNSVSTIVSGNNGFSYCNYIEGKYYISGTTGGTYVYTPETNIATKVNSNVYSDNYKLDNGKYFMYRESKHPNYYSTYAILDPSSDTFTTVSGLIGNSVGVYNINGKDVFVGGILYDMNKQMPLIGIVLSGKEGTKIYNEYVIGVNGVSDLKNQQVKSLKGAYYYADNYNNICLLTNNNTQNYQPQNTYIAVLDLRRNVQ